MIDVSVPVRICDLGGWTDTWFGGPGRVVNIAVAPGVDVAFRTAPGRGSVRLDPDARSLLVAAAIDMCPPPSDVDVEMHIDAAVPAGCGTGTSAAVAVAVLAGLHAVRGEQPPRRDIAYAAHRLEVEVLGLESGIQDQCSAVFGGINYIEIDSYPEADVHALPRWGELGARLSLVFVGRAHDSPGVHREVIAHIEGRDVTAFDRLRDAATAARDAVRARDLDGFGRAMIANNEAQRALHPSLIGADAQRVIDLAAARRALGWKVNGAGGDGGSVTILHGSERLQREFERDIRRLDPRYRALPIAISPTGLEIRNGP
jgi:D-glycero-alpha-D-manno-heptose-7-phosphate kinase